VRRSIVASGVAAILLHGFVLFGLQLDQPAVPLPPASDPIVVGLVAAAPLPGPAAIPGTPEPSSEQPTIPEPQNTTREGRPAKKPVRAPKEPAPTPKASATERREPVAEEAQAMHEQSQCDLDDEHAEDRARRQLTPGSAGRLQEAGA